MAAKGDPKALIHEVFTTEAAHMGLAEAVADFPMKHVNDKAPHVTFSFWHILEHIRIAQTDLLDYVQNAKHVSPSWPDGYWPAPDATTDAAGWKKTIDSYRIGTVLIERNAPLVQVLARTPGWHLRYQDAGSSLYSR